VENDAHDDPDRDRATSAASAAFDRPVAYVRSGNVYVSSGATEKRLTDGGGHARPRWSPNGARLAYLRGGRLWVMNANGSGQRRVSDRAAAGPAWSPDGRWLAFAATGCTGGPIVYRVASTGTAAPEALFPTECRGESLPDATAPGPPATGPLADRLRYDDALAWSPDGTKIAFRGGMCESVYDACLTLGTVATGAEKTVVAYGGGGQDYSGFAVVPAFGPTGGTLSWTAYQQGNDPASSLPVHVVERNLATGTTRTIGASEDRELVYAGGSRALLTGQHKGGSWVLSVDLRTGARTPFRPGSQPSIQS
jgi:Tol biopolymer transport system component